MVQASNVIDFVMFPPSRLNLATSGEYESPATPEEAVGFASPGQLAKGFCIIGVNDTGNCSIGQKLLVGSLTQVQRALVELRRL